MSKSLTDEQRKHILDFQKETKELLRNPQLFNERFDNLFSKYDKDRDGRGGFVQGRSRKVTISIKIRNQ